LIIGGVSPFRRRMGVCISLTSFTSYLGTIVGVRRWRVFLTVQKKEADMTNRIRWAVPERVYETTVRTVDRQFLFVPNHHPENRLLANTCPLNALDLDNDIIPEPSIINIIGSAVGRALEKYPIQIHGLEASINHIHEMLSALLEQLGNIDGFMRCAHSLIARGVNKTWDREGHVFGARSRIHPCVDDTAAENKLLYALTNTIKDNLHERIKERPFFSTYEHQAKGEPLRFWYIDYEAYWAAGGNRKKTHRVKDYLKWVEWSCTVLPSQANRTQSQQQTWLRKQVKEIETECKKERKKNNTSVIGVPALFETDPRDRPAIPKKSGRAPLCHASSKAAREAYKKELRVFVNEFIKASADYRNGNHEREFPEGSYRPPLIKLYTSSRL
jgi:hypothetical protein